MTTWDDAIRGGGLTVKGHQANTHQAQMMAIIVSRVKTKGGDLESAAGAIATAIQESAVTNVAGGDRDSVGLFQQRPSCGWGTPAQCHDPVYATDKFLEKYLPYRARGIGWLQASNLTQRSAYPTAPAPWYGEAMRAARYFAGAGADATVGSGTGSDALGGAETVSREEPYEFSRGSADAEEDSWTCMGRLAQEVGWRRYTANGELWFVSENWLASTPPTYRLREGARGVLSIDFDFETRQLAAEATLRVTAGRYALAPGMCVELVDEGPADGKWLVATTRRLITSNVHEVTLKRAGVALPEPAPNKTSSTVTVGGVDTPRANPDLGSTNSKAATAYAAAEAMSSWNIPYSIAQRQLVTRPPSADCSSSCSWVLMQAGIPLPAGVGKGGWAPVSGQFETWGQAGPGQAFTVMCNAGHIWIRWNGIGPMWRFDTSAHGSGGSGPHQRSTARDTSGFVQRHWPGC